MSENLPTELTAAGAPETPPATPVSAPHEPEILVIPDKYYGAALKAKVPTVTAGKPAEGQTVGRRVGLYVGGGLVALLIAVGVSVYSFRDLIFRKAPTTTLVPTPQPVAPTEPVTQEPPVSPTGLSAQADTPTSVALHWDDVDRESGFRIERALTDASFTILTSVPANTTAFLDSSVQSSSTYRYRVTAIGASGDSHPSDEAVIAVPPVPLVVEGPKLPPSGLDADSDGLTDTEEKLFHTNSNVADTDSDGFLDGNEVFHLYNPDGRSPARLVDAKFVKEYHGSTGWDLAIPTSWKITLDTPDGKQAHIDTGVGEAFRISIEENTSSLPVIDWVLAHHPDVGRDQLDLYRSKQGYEGVVQKSPIVVFLPWNNRMFVMTYEVNQQPFINFRTTFFMILNSLFLRGVDATPVPETTALPFEPGLGTSP